MTTSETNLLTIGAILGGMALVAAIERAVPLHEQGRWHRFHVGPNLALTALTFALGAILNVGLLLLLAWSSAHGFGLLRWTGVGGLAADVLAVIGLDFSFYGLHVAMHRVPFLWRLHRVHHSDPVVDVTTTIRQHPGEGLIRHAVLALFVVGLGPSLEAFVVYRAAAALNGLLEHANVRAPAWLDRALSLVTTWPHLHKIHHSREPAETDSNYGNLFSWFDRLFGTYRASDAGALVVTGLDGLDDAEQQTTKGLLAMPFVERARERAAAIEAR